MKITNPASGEVIKEVATDSAADVSTKFLRAKVAQKRWADTSIDHRIQIIRKFRNLLETQKEALAKTLSLEVGKPISQSRNEIQGTLGRIDFFIEHTPKVLVRENVYSDKSQCLEEMISHEPLGVLANISAWNYPYFVGSNVFIPALLTGNAVLYKPSEFATLTGIAIGELFTAAGLPESLFTPILGEGSIGSSLLKESVDGVFFTGSYPTGKKIAETVAGKLIRVQLELGGKDPIYVCEDTDIEKTAEGTADGAFYNTGQSCCSVERIYVHEKIYDSFLKHFIQTVSAFVIGDPLDDKTYIGPLTRKAQIEVLESQIRDAVGKGAKVQIGGKRLDRAGHYFAPTVVSEVNHSMSIMREESFGPVIGIQKVKDDAEALKLMNDTEYGLTAGIYTKNRNRAEAFLSQSNAGSVYWNCCDRVSPRLPWSGRGHSGIGTTLSTHGIQTFLRLKAWHLKG